MTLNYEGSFKLSRFYWQTQLINEESPANELFDSLVSARVHQLEHHSGYRNVRTRVARNKCLVEICKRESVSVNASISFSCFLMRLVDEKRNKLLAPWTLSYFVRKLRFWHWQLDNVASLLWRGITSLDGSRVCIPLVLELVISVRVITHRATVMVFRLRQSRAYF